jgi:vancomycin permeability regulator SanA
MRYFRPRGIVSTLVRVALRIGVAIALCWLVAMALICLRGITTPFEEADVAVVLGNALNADGTPKLILAARLDTALKCHRAGRCPVLFVSGSIDGPGLNEATAMRTWLIAHGLARDAIIVDEHGDNTLASARNAVAFMREHRMTRVMLITHYYHLARARLAFERAGAAVVLGAFPHQFRAMDVYSSWREVPAYAVYLVRLALDGDARPVSFRPVRFLLGLFSKSD